MRRIYRVDGIYGFTRGYSGMMMRDAPGFAAYFCLFGVMKKVFGVHPDNCKKCDHNHFSNVMKKLLSGGIAGVTVWTMCFPADLIKSTMQTHEGERLKFF